MYCMCVTMHQVTRSEGTPPSISSSIMQPLDQGIILSVKKRYKKKLSERYLVSVENNKNTNALINFLDIVAATNMVSTS